MELAKKISVYFGFDETRTKVSLCIKIHTLFRANPTKPIAARHEQGEELSIMVQQMHLYIIKQTAVCIPLPTRHRVKQMHAMLPHYHITYEEGSYFS
jgi:hypothetical protein